MVGWVPSSIAAHLPTLKDLQLNHTIKTLKNLISDSNEQIDVVADSVRAQFCDFLQNGNPYSWGLILQSLISWTAGAFGDRPSDIVEGTFSLAGLAVQTV